MKPAGPEEDALRKEGKSRGISFLLPAFIVISLLAHIGTFFLFNVVYPERATLPSPPPPIYVLTDSNPENQALLQWIESENPALIAIAPQIQPPNLRKAEYRPSYQTIRTSPRSMAEGARSSRPLQAKEPLSIIRSSGKTSAPAPAFSKSQPTTLSFSGGLSARALGKPILLSFSKSAEPLDQARFLVGVTDHGDVRFSFVQKSSGSKIFDAEAEAQLKRIVFVQSESAMTWGFATVDWGSSVYEMADVPARAGSQNPPPR